MKINLEVYPQKIVKNIYSELKKRLEPYSKLFENEISFKLNNIEVSDIPFDFNNPEENYASIDVITPVTEYITIAASKIDPTVFSAEDILDGLTTINNECIKADIVENFDNTGFYYILESSTKQLDVKIMFLIAIEISFICNGLINFDNGEEYGFRSDKVYEPEIFTNLSKIGI